MMGNQCPRCLRYRGDLTCDAFPQGIPEEVLTGAHDHAEPYRDEQKLYAPVPEPKPAPVEQER